MGQSHTKTTPRIIEVAPDFYNIRGNFKVIAGLVNLGTQMSLARLSSGRFLVLDTIPLDDELKEEIDELTQDGELIEAVLALHPFHTLSFEKFYEAYPDVPYYGCPRHIRVLPDIPWAGEFRDDDPSTLAMWEPEIEMRIPAGAEFEFPVPESSNHFNSVFCFHVASRTIHIDDTVMNYEGAGFIINKIASKNGVQFHPSLSGPALRLDACAPGQFRDWVNGILEDWDFDNLCLAHVSNVIGDAKEQLRQCLEDNEDLLNELETNVEKRRKKLKKKVDDIEKFNVEGDNCG
eukprot:TRINITY_DN12430_c0_g1_i1.p1 TRINITY_DN12430_c0_g1~~TRINITY_DN12430_c0_g1_i1.p1  ORF type:complete len:291 (-),score=65.83 TRINITY_DN12430_c0_g1_i1:114-986(-)